MKPTQFYQLVMSALEWRIVELGWTMQQCDDKSGVQDGHTAKMLHPDTRSGRQARWETADLLVQALFPDGYEIRFAPISTALTGQNASRFASGAEFAANAMGRRNLRHQFATELARFAGRQRVRKLTPEQRRELAQRAALSRWHRRREQTADQA